MKSIFFGLLAFSVITLSPTSHAGTSCNIANEVICHVDLDSNTINVRVHNSSRGYCGIKIVSNQNHAFLGRGGEIFAAGLKNSLSGIPDALVVKPEGNTIVLSEAAGSLPFLFVVDTKIETIDGRPLRNLVEKSLRESHLDGPVSLSLTAVECPE